MRLAAILLLLVAGGVICYFLVPRGAVLMVRWFGGGYLVVSRTSVGFVSGPDHYVSGAFDHIESHVDRLLAAPRGMRFLRFFTPAGDRGFSLHANGDAVEAYLTVQRSQEPETEAAIRAFFNVLDIRPTQDYLAANGGVPEATRVLAYPLTGSSSEIAALSRRILQEVCGVSPAEPLHIGYSGR
jgi:hypothetical protein